MKKIKLKSKIKYLRTFAPGLKSVILCTFLFDLYRLKIYLQFRKSQTEQESLIGRSSDSYEMVELKYIHLQGKILLRGFLFDTHPWL